jgi:hypothetical protein
LIKRNDAPQMAARPSSMARWRRLTGPGRVLSGG